VSGAPQAGTGVVAAKLGTTRRTDGQTEVTYNGHPLYYYAADTGPGQTQGQDLNQFGGTWHVVAPTGTEIDHGA
jgi:predicted lipoprotein with Yx(FWY)xxD motif